MQNNENFPVIPPLLDPETVPDEERLRRELTEEEKEADVVPEDFDHFNLDAVEKLKENEDEE